MSQFEAALKDAFSDDTQDDILNESDIFLWTLRNTERPEPVEEMTGLYM